MLLGDLTWCRLTCRPAMCPSLIGDNLAGEANRDDYTSHLQHLSTLSCLLTVIIGKFCSRQSFFSLLLNLKICVKFEFFTVSYIVLSRFSKDVVSYQQKVSLAWIFAILAVGGGYFEYSLLHVCYYWKKTQNIK